MRRMLKSARPSPAMVVGIVALVLAVSGSAIGATKLIGLGAFKDGLKDKTVGVGKLHYVTKTEAVASTPTDGKTINAACPSGFKPIGGAVKTDKPANTSNYSVFQQYPTTTGWTAVIRQPNATSEQISVIAICAKSRVITGTPPSA